MGKFFFATHFLNWLCLNEIGSRKSFRIKLRFSKIFISENFITSLDQTIFFFAFSSSRKSIKCLLHSLNIGGAQSFFWEYLSPILNILFYFHLDLFSVLPNTLLIYIQIKVFRHFEGYHISKFYNSFIIPWIWHLEKIKSLSFIFMFIDEMSWVIGGAQLILSHLWYFVWFYVN